MDQKTCQYCGEHITPQEEEEMAVFPHMKGVMHHECMFRGVAGSIGHQKKTCSCYGGKDEDPPGMTLRQAAVAALHYWREHHETQELSA